MSRNLDQKEEETRLIRLHPHVTPVRLVTPTPIGELIISFLTLRELANSYIMVHSSIYDLRSSVLKAPHQQLECKVLQQDLGTRIVPTYAMPANLFNLYTISSAEQKMLEEILPDDKKNNVQNNMSWHCGKTTMCCVFLFFLASAIVWSIILAKNPQNSNAIVCVSITGLLTLIIGGIFVKATCEQRQRYTILRQSIRFSSNLLTTTPQAPLLINEHKLNESKIEVVSDNDSDDEDEAKSTPGMIVI